ncbi:MAG: hypothetical protein HQK83_00545 [Fibrobacteria bacterium]|nr:hypothetical protein [Fibrobacteria bacterium]
MNTHLADFYSKLLKKQEATYPLEFYRFLYELITTTAFSEKLMLKGDVKEYHLSPKRICSLFGINIKQEFGIFSAFVLQTWGITTSKDIGVAIFKMAEYNTLKLSGTETIEEFISAGLEFPA